MLGISEIWVILLIIIILFGPSSIPRLARSFGKAKGEFKKGIEEANNETADKLKDQK